ncbi:P-type conjugative transfer protein TrbJ [Desulfovibrio sp. JC010]|uniref:P-type conjugative transfer protein TrbJ n=1 Tax=Desulfovibrio sp. JC010 TaxID=2593641 RepID=UPI0013D8A9CC|nr:P-type conjugative transfer protein TrbJ [Desulfovibrio sp. JC010]NDV26924.1 P-type conjugative transfer protein TrbJ [Desulfovibrio sp. JC010]
MKSVINLIFILFILINSTPAKAMTVTCTNCSDKFLQMLERVTNIEQLETMYRTYAEEMMQTQQQIMMVKQNIEQYVNMVKNTIRLPFAIKNSVIRDFKQLASLTMGLKETVSNIDVLDGVYDAYYPNFNSAKQLVGLPASEVNPKYYEYYAKWSERVDEATEATFKLSGQQLKEISESEEFDAYIDDLLSSPEGRMQALEAANQLSSIQISEMRKLRALMAMHIQNQAQIQQKKEKIDQLKAESRKMYFENDLAEQAKQFIESE